MFLVSLLSAAVNDRARVSMIANVYALPFLVASNCPPANPNPWIYYDLALVLLCYPSTYPIQVGWCSRNSGAVASRTVNASLNDMFVQAGSIISANIYRESDRPRYRRGNAILISIACANVGILYPGTKLYYMWRNKQRDRVWNAVTSEEKAHDLTTTKDVGNRRLEFRFAY